MTPWTAAHQPSPSFSISQSLLKLMAMVSVTPCNHLIVLIPFSSCIFPSLRVFSNESALCIRWPKYWSFTFSISPSNEYSGRISFGMNWLALLAVQGTLKSLLQYHSSKASILQRSALFMVQLSHPYLTTGKTCHVVNIIISQPKSRGLHFTCARRTWQHLSGYRVQGHKNDSIYPQRNIRPQWLPYSQFLCCLSSSRAHFCSERSGNLCTWTSPEIPITQFAGCYQEAVGYRGVTWKCFSNIIQLLTTVSASSTGKTLNSSSPVPEVNEQTGTSGIDRLCPWETSSGIRGGFPWLPSKSTHRVAYNIHPPRT